MKAVYISIVAIVLLVGCDESKQPTKNAVKKDSAPSPSTTVQPQSTNSIAQEQSKPDKPKYEIWEAASIGAIKIVNELLDAGVDVNSLDKRGRTPLHWAASRGRSENIQTLFAAGAYVMARGGDGWTPLHWAASSGTSDNIEVLLAAGADAKAKSKDGKTPWDLAQENEEAEGTKGYWALNDAQYN